MQTNGILFWGNSFVAGPQGEFLAQAGNERPENIVVEVDLERSENVRRWWPFLRDRRIDAYAGLTKRFLDNDGDLWGRTNGMSPVCSSGN